MKYILIILLSWHLSSTTAQQHTLEKMWETDTIIAVPESVLNDINNKTLYISLIDGNPWDADGTGGIGKLDTNGKGYNGNWVKGLNAPKGMGIYKNRLFVADINNVVVIDISNGKIEKKIPIDSAMGLNDITVNEEGIVYVSDSKLGNIWRIENDKPELYIPGLKGLNGLKFIKSDLFIGAGKSFIKSDNQKQINNIAELDQPIDGIEPVGNGDFIVTSWSGYIFYINANGKIETLLDTHNEKRNTADIGYDIEKHIVYVPTFFAKTIAAYRLK